MNQFPFQGAREAFRYGVLIAVAPAAHAVPGLGEAVGDAGTLDTLGGLVPKVLYYLSLPDRPGKIPPQSSVLRLHRFGVHGGSRLARPSVVASRS